MNILTDTTNTLVSETPSTNCVSWLVDSDIYCTWQQLYCHNKA